MAASTGNQPRATGTGNCLARWRQRYLKCAHQLFLPKPAISWMNIGDLDTRPAIYAVNLSPTHMAHLVEKIGTTLERARSDLLQFAHLLASEGAGE